MSLHRLGLPCPSSQLFDSSSAKTECRSRKQTDTYNPITGTAATVPLASGAAREFLPASYRSVFEVVAHIKANMDDPMLVETGIRTLRIIAARNAVNFKVCVP